MRPSIDDSTRIRFFRGPRASTTVPKTPRPRSAPESRAPNGSFRNARRGSANALTVPARSMIPRLALFVVLILASAPALIDSRISPQAPAEPVPADLANLAPPAGFEANSGQFDSATTYGLHHRGVDVSLGKNSARFRLVGSSGDGRAVSTSFTLAWDHSLNPEPNGELSGRSNYLTGSDSKNWVTGITSFRKVTYRGVGDGIDLVFRATATGVEYDLELAPGADATGFQMAIADASSLSVEDDGRLAIVVADSKLHHSQPVSFQMISGVEVPVKSSYRVDGGGYFGFDLGSYDRGQSLLVDPIVADYSTYDGGGSGEAIYGLQTDSTGAIYTVGTTSSTNYPIAGGVQGAYGGGSSDAFVTKYTADGQSRVFSTFLGGSALEFGASIAVAPDGSPIVVGFTASSNFPTASAIFPSKSGAGDAFVSKLAPDGSSLVFSTYIGGSLDEQGDAVALGPSGTVFVSGSTASSNFPTANPFQASYGGGGSDGFIAELSPTGAGLIYSSTLGGTGADYAPGLRVDSTGAAYLSGQTSSTNFPTTSPMQAAYGGGFWDGFVTKVAPDGASKIYSTYLGGSGDEVGQDVAVDAAGNAYVVGRTSSGNFPTASPLQASIAGGDDGFLSKLNPGGSGLVYSTYLGGAGSDFAHDIVLDSDGAAIIGGYTASSNFPLVAATQGTYGGGQDGFLARVVPSGGSMDFSTYAGGASGEWGEAVAIAPSGAIYFAGETDSSNFPIANSIKSSLSGSADNFIVRYALYGTISGTFTNGGASRVTAYRVSDGTPAATSFMNGSGAWSMSLPVQDCSGGGYKIYAEAPAGYQPRWYNLKDNYASADCVAAPASNVDMTLPPASTIDGTVTDTDTGFLLDGALIYVFRDTDGAFVGWTVSGRDGTGRYRISVAGGFTYKILIHPGNGKKDHWAGGSDWNSAASTSPGSTVDFNVGSSPLIQGYVKAATTASNIDGAVVYVWKASTGAFVGYGISGGSGPGRYAVPVDSGDSYRALVHAPDAYEDLWTDGAPGYGESTPTAAPGTANFSLRDAALIQGTASHLGSGENDILVSAYTTCGCTSPQNTLSGPGGAYSLKVVSTSASGWQYRLRFIRPNGAVSWYASSPGFGGATDVASPSGSVNEDVPG